MTTFTEGWIGLLFHAFPGVKKVEREITSEMGETCKEPTRFQVELCFFVLLGTLVE